MPNKAVTIYVTKDATERGITVGKEHFFPDSGRRFVSRLNASGSMPEWIEVEGGEWFNNFAEAKKDAEYRRRWKLRALEDQIAAIRAIDLTKPVEG